MVRKIDLRILKWQSKQGGGSIGMLPKDTVMINNVMYYVKMSSYNIPHGVYGIESISEVVASRLAKILGIDCIEVKLYNALVVKDGREFWTYLCISKDYNKGKLDVEAFEDYYTNNRLKNEGTIEFCTRMGFRDKIDQTFIFDYLINNFDRHGANTEVIIKTNGNTDIAPLFDNGASLYHTFEESRVGNAYYGEDCRVNNYIGSQSLLENIKTITKAVKVNKLTQGDRKRLFYNLSEVISKQRKDTIWDLILRRYTYARDIQRIEER